jgi:hypothetical protein
VLRSGDARGGVDVRLRTVPSARVSGRLESSDGPIGIAPLFLLIAGPTGEPLGSVADAVATTVADASGAFTFLGVPAGRYALVAVKMPTVTERAVRGTVVQTPGGTVSRGVIEPVAVSPKAVYWAVQQLAVTERDTSDLRVMLKPGFRVSGRITFEGGPPAGVRNLTVLIESTEDWLRTFTAGEFEALVPPDGVFALLGVPGGRYQLTVPLPQGLFVKNVMVNGRDVSDLPFTLDQDLRDVVVAVSARGARVSGIVRDGKNRPDSTAGVIVFPADPRAWVDLSAYPRRLRDVRTSRDGAYTVADLPAGEYLIVAAPQAAFDWSLPNFFERLSRVATRVTLAEAEQRTLELRVQNVVVAGLQPGASAGGLKPAGYGRR